MSRVCPACEKGLLVASACDEVICHSGVKLTVRGYEISTCNACGEEVVLADQAKRNAVRVADAKHEFEGTWTTSQIQKWRARWKLTQQDASELLGGGQNAFSKYERGEVMQSKSMDLLMRASDKIADLREFLAERSGVAFGVGNVVEAWGQDRDWAMARLNNWLGAESNFYLSVVNTATVSSNAGNDSNWHTDSEEDCREYA